MFQGADSQSEDSRSESEEVGRMNERNRLGHGGGMPNILWLCQNSYWKWPFIVDFPINNGDFP